MGGVVLRYIESSGVEYAGDVPAGVVRFTRPMESLSCAVLNGGHATIRAAFIMQVPKNYDGDFRRDVADARDALGLPEDTMGMMTAAEVEHVFNLAEVSHNGTEVAAFATAGLSNHVVAGEVLDDYEEKSAVSARRAAALRPGTINICVVSPVPLRDEGRVNLMIPLVEGKSAALAARGFRETGTTSDAMAVISPPGEDGVTWAGTGSDVGIAAARAVSAAVGRALEARDEHPAPMTAPKVLGRMGLTAEDLRRISGSTMGPEEYARGLGDLLSSDGATAAADIAWALADRVDSIADDGSPAELDLVTGLVAGALGVAPETEGGLLDRLVAMISKGMEDRHGRR